MISRKYIARLEFTQLSTIEDFHRISEALLANGFELSIEARPSEVKMVSKPLIFVVISKADEKKIDGQ